jgi:hypothetical protein
MNSVDLQSQAGESPSTGVGLSSVYAGFEAKVEKSVSIMDVSGEADTNGKTETDSGCILHRRMALRLSRQARLQVDAHPSHTSQRFQSSAVRSRADFRYKGGCMNWEELVSQDDAAAFIEMLSEACHVRKPRLSFAGRTNRRGFYRTRSKMICVGKQTKLWILAHEFAHYLDHIENGHGANRLFSSHEWHSQGFYYKLRRVTRLCGGAYPWSGEYKQIARWAKADMAETSQREPTPGKD